MVKTHFFIHLCILGLIKVFLCDDTIEVKLKQGVALGKIENTLFKNENYYAFRGIPYAAAPINELRFKPPTAHKGWNDTLKAFKHKATCMQYSARMRMDESFGISGSEDCLFINIYTPNIKGESPVIVFDYNDVFGTGFNGTKTFSPENFLEEGVVVVTIGYRLGLLGFLTTEDDVIPGNNGLRDFIFGLEWVRDNIRYFGGNPEKVTLMGSVGGGALVNMLLYSEKAKGLFAYATIQSGNAHETAWFHEDSRLKAFELGKELNIETEDSEKLLEELQKVDAVDLLSKVIQVLANSNHKDSQTKAQPFSPIIEHNDSDAVLSALPGNGPVVNDVPIIIGFNSREGLDFTSHFLSNPILLTYKAQEQMLQFPIRTGYRFDRESEIYKEVNQEIAKFYLGDKILDDNTAIEYSVYAGDVIQGYSLNYAAKHLSENLKSPVFFYMFDFRGQLNENSQYISQHSRYESQLYGATVLDELCYLHICNRIRRDYVQLRKRASEPAERKVLRRMVRMWTNFAKTGNPTPTGDEILKGFSWEPVSKNNGLNYLHITKKLQMRKNPLGERGEFWDNLLAKYSEMVADGLDRGNEKHEEL